MLKQISLKNFKAFKELTLDLADITILIGPQGVGKSTILDALLLLAQSAGQPQLNLYNTRFKEERYADLVHKQKERDLIEFELNFDFIGAYPPITNGPNHVVRYSLIVDSMGFRGHTAEYLFPEQKWEFSVPREKNRITPISLPLTNQLRLELKGYNLILLPFTVGWVAVPPEMNQASVQNLKLIAQELAGYFRNIYSVPTNREIMENTCSIEKLATPFSSKTGVLNWLANNWDARDRVVNWLHSIVERRLGFRQAGNQLVIETSNASGLLHSIMSEGSGLRQLIWPLTALAASDFGSVVAIEEPEIHLHPKAQARLCEVFCEAIREENKRLLFTTHSEHMLMGFLTAVAQGQLRPENLAIYYLDIADGVATAERLDVNEQGMVEGGLKGFFEAGLDELEAYLGALSKQKI